MRRRGFTLVVGMCVTAILLVMGLALLGIKMAQYRGAMQASQSAQAAAIAEAGLEDARAKLEKDPSFPPRLTDDTLTYSYAEDFTDVDGAFLGRYTVTIDMSKSRAPWRVVLLTSQGTLGSESAPQARRRLHAELDVAPTLRVGGGPNPNYFKLLNWRDDSSL
ncbi:MAG: hypothetical protein FJX76_00285 [Armatimonadetes bacterium]|nr:hypothetical protein [Armatimonadota bacterium]